VQQLERSGTRCNKKIKIKSAAKLGGWQDPTLI
jgi:hypothetical protein